MKEEIKERSLKNQREIHVKNMEKREAEHKKELAIRDEKHAEEIAQLIEKYEKQLEAERKLRSPKRFTFDLKFSQIAKWFVSICIVATISFAGNIKQAIIYKECTKTIKELETYSTIVRLIIARNDNIVSDIHRIWQEYQTPDNTELKRFIEDKILEYETGERLMKKR
ncbi:MAG: hypothetical protein LBH22_08180 [Bacteroidales bacterium]|jgi:uncharacterized membrane protein YdbT with pleckstrin-like domain|nr:hypothetical protein [Bacteroidales bacterium]